MTTTDKKPADILNGAVFQDKKFLRDSFIEICKFIEDNPDRLSLPATAKEKASGFTPSVAEEATLIKLAEKHVKGYLKNDVPSAPSTVPDNAVSVVLCSTFGYSEEDAVRIKIEHQHSMSSENCVGALLERYIDSVLSQSGWHWCCGDFVKAIDFIHFDEKDGWSALQIKNRDNTENSSSSAIRNGTPIDKWYRSFSKSTKKSRELDFVNWENLPEKMKGFGLSEAGFNSFIKAYIKANK
jgi:hypothetical protein